MEVQLIKTWTVFLHIFSKANPEDAAVATSPPLVVRLGFAFSMCSLGPETDAAKDAGLYHSGRTGASPSDRYFT